ncbi:hypothetical protein F4212_06425 [Candidatus Poribacteria bacterium]|nr:hypothetical protein [Candidatus Poribacteria bacterium]
MNNTRYFPATIATRAMHADMPEHDDDKYWIRVTASNDKPDLHHSIMDPKTTLRNFEADAKTMPGVALKDHHAYRSFGYGRSNNALLTDKNELMIDFYILKNMEYEGQGREFRTSEKLIRAIEHGLINQVSVGFYGEREVCNLCNREVRRWYWWDNADNDEYCTHKPGKKYDVGDGRMQTATYTVYDAHLKEVSLVEFGSNRDTSIENIREMRGVIEEILMTDKQWIERLREALDIPSIAQTDDPDAVVRTLQTEVQNLREQVNTLTNDAEASKTFRQARVDEAIKHGIRAYGENFDEAYHRAYYADLPIAQLEKHIAHSKKLGDGVLPSGRSTSDNHEPPEDLKARLKRRARRR